MIANVEKLTAQQYLALYQSNPASIKAVKFVPPTLGKAGFGYFLVEKDNPNSISSTVLRLLADLK